MVYMLYIGRLTLSHVWLQHATEEQQDPQYVSSHGNLRSSSTNSVDRCICKRKERKSVKARDDDRQRNCECPLIFSRAEEIKFPERYFDLSYSRK